jgi:tetratricopeptide (TPR) repeat protein
LADARPGAFLPDLAASLSNQSAMFRDLGRHDDAFTAIEEAVAIDRRLAAERPGAFLPNLSTALNNQAAMLRDLGRHEEAVAAIAEAVAIHRRLAAARPDAFLPELSTTLHNQSTMLLDLGRYEDAYDANEEALRIVLPMLERAHYILPDAGASLLQNYLHRCEDTGRRPDLQVVLRMRAVLVSAGLISGD